MITAENAMRARAAAGLFLGSAIVGACEWSAVSMAHGYQVPFHPVLASLYSPIDSAHWQWILNQHCILGPALTDWFVPPFLRGHPIAHCAASLNSFVANLDVRFAALFGVGLVPAAVLWAGNSQQVSRKKRGRVLQPIRTAVGSFALDLGKTTGTMRKLGASSGLAPHQRVVLSEEDASLDMAVIGSKGTGKTESVMSPILLQVFQTDAGVLAFDAKGNFTFSFRALARVANRTARIVGIGPDAEQLDLLDGVSPTVAATYIQSVLMSLGGDTSKDEWWNSQARMLAENVLILLASLPYEFYSLSWLYRYIEEPTQREMINAKIKLVLEEKAAALEQEPAGSKAAREIVAEIRVIENAQLGVSSFMKLKADDTVKVGVRMNIKRALEDMARPLYEDAFGRSRKAKAARLEELLDGAAFIVNCPSTASGNTAMAFLKLKFYDLMLSRLSSPNLNTARRVLFLVDELQAVVTTASTGMSDHAFLSVSRETRAMCVFATQTIEGLIAKIGSTATNALLGNLRQKVLLQTDCKETIANVLYLLGKTEVVRESKNEQRQPFSWFAARGVSAQPVQQEIADASLIRNLRKGQALFLGNVGMENADDVIQLNRVQVEKSTGAVIVNGLPA